MHFKVFVLSSICLLLPSLLFSQVIEPDKSRSGSIYSSIGFGNIANQNSSHTNGMGLTGVATLSLFSPSLSNPAHWGSAEFTQSQLSLSMTNYEASDDFSSSSNSKFSFDNFQFVFPILRNELGASISVTPITRADFARVDEGSFQLPGSGDTIEFATSTIGSGGINRFEFGLGYKFNDNFSVGYAASGYILSKEEDITTSFSDARFELNNQPSVINEEFTGSGFGNRFGIYTQFRNLGSQTDRIVASATLNLPVSIDSDRSVETFRTVNGVPRRVELNENSPGRDGNIELPLEINTGLTYYLNQFHIFATEYQYQNWENAEYSYNLTEQGYFKDRTKVGVGYQYQPFFNQQSRGFFSNFRYSLGATYDNGFLSISDQDIETVMFHAGLTIPSQRNRSSIDLSFNYGIRGTESENLVKENIWGFKVSLNLAEFMFLRQRFQ